MRRFLVVVLVLILVALIVPPLLRERDDRHVGAPSTGKFVNAAAAEVFVQDAGSGPAVVLIHGTGAWSEIWRGTIDPLVARGYRVIAIDVPPFGYSERLRGRETFASAKQAERIIGVLDALKINEATFVGHSVGARPTVAVALAHPSRIRKLILVDPALGAASTSPVYKSGVLFRTAIGATGTNPLLTERLFRTFVSRKEAVTRDRVALLQRPLSIRDTTAAQAEWLAGVMTEAPPDVKALKMPVTLIWGRDDTVTPLAQAEAIPHEVLEVIDGAGHIPYIEKTEEFNARLLASLAGPGR